jgi:4-hydroxybenzoate polyprenyltransferase
MTQPIQPQTVPDSQHRGLMAILPPVARDYAALARLDRPIGWWLLFWPCAWGVLLGGGMPSLLTGRWGLLAWLLLGSVAMRGAGCVYNDIVDADIDQQVARTRARPIASGRVSKRRMDLAAGPVPDRPDRAAATPLAGAACGAGLAGAGRGLSVHEAYHRLAPGMAGAGLHMGRPCRLGGSDGLRTPRSPRPALPRLLGWCMGYDTIYACQDREDDVLVGIGSSALSLGGRIREGVLGFYAVALIGWGMAFWRLRPDALVLVALAPVTAHLLWQALSLNPEDGGGALARFRANRFAGVLMALACWVVGNA